MAVPFFDISRQNNSQKAELDQVIRTVIDSGRYILGENVAALEKEVAAFVGTKFAVGVASGTDALHLAIRAAGVGPGDEVITSPFTFVATIEAIAYCGATPVFVDIEPNTFNVDPLAIEAKITRKTKALLPVHLYGQSCQMESIMALANKHKLLVIEDCAQSMGATFNGQQVGSFGAAGCFSFFPTKNIGCFGDGGLVTTNDQALYEEIKVLRGHGSRTTYHYDLVGYNSRLDELHAAILRVKLRNIGALLDARRRNAAFYAKELAGLSHLTLPSELSGARHTYNQFTVRSTRREALVAHLKAAGVPAMVYYPLSLHLQAAYSSLGYKLGDFPVSESAQSEVLSLPIFPELTSAELASVAAAVKDFGK
ncbi:MAG: DegT/DnrJ/EryC1/StrS family aminotransferase [Candidatus Margulisbacteria bacterium]|jgi:dTDP-4-amino-4,6-dideoxygalactose transaminase|nr:DegT/DnrJ/EryC1/StrS family aminotransferase [Candidatus Margulisiibacteriota bacterium]